MKKTTLALAIAAAMGIAACKPPEVGGAFARPAGKSASTQATGSQSGGEVPPCAQEPIPEGYSGPMCPN